MRDHGREMIEFVRSRIQDDPALRIDLDTPLVSSGLVDSFALVEVLQRLQDVTGRAIPTGRVAPQDLETVSRMLELARRFPEKKS